MIKLLLACVFFALINASVLDNLLNDSISRDPKDIVFYLFPSVNNLSDFDVLKYNDLNSIKKTRFSSNKKVVFLTHGFVQNVKSDFTKVLVRDYLNAGFGDTTNIIAVDWGKLSGAYIPVDLPAFLGNLEQLPLYLKVVKNVPVVGKRLYEFICFLQNNNKISRPSRVHLVGHSLGAHISGYAGKYYYEATKTKLDRITGTDPAGPLFYLRPSSERLNPSDAKFVDVVHTNNGLLGYSGALGHVDFYVNNGGPLQPGCLVQIIYNPYCSHHTAPHYYGKSIGNNSLRASTGILRNEYVTFGEFVERATRGSYSIRMALPANELPPADVPQTQT